MFFTRFGDDLLSHVLRRSTIGATALNCRVRDGIGCFARAMTTKPKKRPRRAGYDAARFQTSAEPGVYLWGFYFRYQIVPSPGCNLSCSSCVAFDCQCFSQRPCPGMANFIDLAVSGSNQAYRAISTSQLKALPLLHLWPIDVVVFHGSQGRPCFEGGFPLRCLQRLSCPNIATQHYRWHDNWSTSGSFTPVLSY